MFGDGEGSMGMSMNLCRMPSLDMWDFRVTSSSPPPLMGMMAVLFCKREP